MDTLPANTGGKVPATRPSALDTIKDGSLKMLGKARSEAGEAIHAAGVSVEKLHQRVILVIAGLLVMLFLGALFRSFGMLWVNYLLIALFGLSALYAFLQPVHIAGMLLVGGGVALARDPRQARARRAAHPRRRSRDRPGAEGPGYADRLVRRPLPGPRSAAGRIRQRESGDGSGGPPARIGAGAVQRLVGERRRACRLSALRERRQAYPMPRQGRKRRAMARGSKLRDSARGPHALPRHREEASGQLSLCRGGE